MSYEKHVWGGGVPNRNKLIDMDEGIEALDSNKMDKPSNTGTIGQVLKKTATGSEWSNGGGGGGSTAGDITYDSTATYADGTVGKELKEQSEKIVNLSHDYSTTEFNTGRKWIDGKDVWERTFVFDYDMSGSSTTLYLDLQVLSVSIDNIVKWDGFLRQDDDYFIPMNQYRFDVGAQIYDIDFNQTTLIARFEISKAWVGTGYLTIQYTKGSAS